MKLTVSKFPWYQKMQARASFESKFESGPLAISVLTEVSAIARLAGEWNTLLTRSVCNRAFSSAEWFLASCAANPSFQPYAIIARKGAELAGILPLVLIEEGALATFPSYLTDYSDAIVARDDFAVVAGLLDHARAEPNGYRRLVLRHIRRDSNCMRAIAMPENRSADRTAFREMVGCHYLRLPATYDDFLRTKDSRFRKRLKRLQALSDDSNFVVSELVPGNFPPHKLADVFLSLHLARQTVRSCFESAAAQTFAREVIPDLFKKGIVRACALTAGERVVAITRDVIPRDAPPVVSEPEPQRDLRFVAPDSVAHERAVGAGYGAPGGLELWRLCASGATLGDICTRLRRTAADVASELADGARQGKAVDVTRLLGPERVEAIRAAARGSNGDMVAVRRRLPFPAALAEIRLALTVA